MQAADPAPRSGTASADPLEKRSFFWSMVGLGMLVWVSLTGAWTLRQVSQSDYWVDHTNEVLRNNERVLADIRESESAERGNIITGDESYLAPYQAAQHDLPESMQKLQELIRDNPGQKAKLNELQALISERIGVLNHALSQRRSGGFEAAQQVVQAGQGLMVMQKIREVSGQIETEELRLLQERTQARQTRLRDGYIAVVVALVLALVALLTAPFDVRRAVRQRNVAASAHAESESTAHALFETASQGIFIVNHQGRIVMANPSSARMLGYEPGELIGLTIESLVPERFHGEHPSYRDGYFHNPQNRPMGIGRDLWARRKDGSEFPAEISLSYIRSEQGLLAVAFLTDISKRKADEKAIKQQREDLRALTGRMMTAQDDERRRIARDLHDDLSQKLAFLAMDMGKLANKESSEGFVSEVRPLQMRAADAAMTVRKISHQLHPSVLDDIGLEAALEQYCEEFESRTGISTQFTSKNVPDPLRKEIASSLYHIAQECLRNAAKHSKTETVAVELEFSGGVLHLIVRDQGVGLRGQEDKKERGIGMVGMQERAHLVNGKVSVQSETGEGTEVRVEVPLEAG
jgi:PAS domain S-box-containing protein